MPGRGEQLQPQIDGRCHPGVGSLRFCMEANSLIKFSFKNLARAVNSFYEGSEACAKVGRKNGKWF